MICYYASVFKRFEVVHTSADFFDAVGVEVFAFDDYRHAEVKRFLSDCCDGRFAEAERFADAAFETVFKMDDVYSVLESFEKCYGIDACVERPERVDLKVD